MCSTEGLIALQVGGSVSDFVAGDAAADTQEHQQKLASQSLVESTLQQEAALEIERQQSQEEITREKLASTREGRRIRASSIVAQAEGGQVGASAERVIADLERQADTKQVRLDSRSESVNDAALASLRGLTASHYNKLNEINQPINKPSIAGALLGITADVVQTKVMTKAIQAKAAGQPATLKIKNS